MKQINKWLKKTYGTNLNGDATFRVVFSDFEKEKRIGKFAEWYGKIFLREFNGVQDVKKYPWIKGRWILERWVSPILAYTPDIPGTAAGSYEPVQVFEHSETGEPVPVTERILTEIIWTLFHPPLPGHRKSLLVDEHERQFEMEVAHNFEVLTDAGSTLRKDGEAII